MRNSPTMLTAALIFSLFACTVAAANKETIETTDAYISQQDVSVAVYGHNQIGLFENFNLIVFDDTRLDFVSIAADRGAFWYGNYPTQVVGNKIYIHGWAGGVTSCIDPDSGEPGSPLLHLNFNVRSGAAIGTASVVFSSEPVFDGHWVDCSFGGVNPPPEYYDGGIDIVGHANHITIGEYQADESGRAVVDIKMHNGLDVFEYFHQILFDSSLAGVDSLVASRGTLHTGFYPTHVSGDTVYVHGWADTVLCFHPDLSSPGASLYRIYFCARDGAPGDTTMDLEFIGSDPVWNHWVGCDLTTTDSFTASDGSIYFPPTTSSLNTVPPTTASLYGNYPNPFNPATTIEFELPRPAAVDLNVFDLNGRLVRELVAGKHMDTGRHKVLWGGRDDSGRTVATGVYFYRLETGTFSQTKRMILLK